MESRKPSAATGNGATLAIGQVSGFAATISGFGLGDTIDLLGLSATSASINGSNQLVVLNGSTTVATLKLAGSYATASLNVVSDGNGGVDVTLASLASSQPPGAGHAMSAFVSAMAGIGGAAGAAVTGAQPLNTEAPRLLAPIPGKDHP